MVRMIVFSLIFLSQHAVAKTSINWLVWDLSPEFIRHGPYKNQGFADAVLARIQQGLPEYNHAKVWVNTQRWGVERVKEGSCTPHVWGHFLQQVYSKPYTLTEPYGIVVHKRLQKKFGEPGTVLSLEQLLKNDKLTIALLPLYPENSAGSRYPILEPYIKPYLGKRNVFEMRSGKNQLDLNLLEKGRADYALTFSNNVTSQIKINKMENSYVYYPLKENLLYKKIYVSCSDNELGKEITRKINKLIDKDFIEFVVSQTKIWNENPSFIRMIERYYLDEETLLQVVEEHH